MTGFVATVLSVVASAPAGAGTPAGLDEMLRPGAVLVRAFSFESPGDGGTDDLDYNLLPDNWRRITRRGYPPYVACRIADDKSVDGKRSLRFTLDGGNAAYLSPPVAASAHYEYLVDAWVRTKGLERDDAFLTLNFLDRNFRYLRQYARQSQKRTGTTQWQRVQVVSSHPADPEIAHLSIGCHLVGRKGNDIRGQAWFDRIVVSRIPRLSVSTSAPFDLFVGDVKKAVQCQITGIDGQDLELHVRVRSMAGDDVWSRRQAIAPDADGRFQATWPLPDVGVGQFVVDAELSCSGRRLVGKGLHLLVAPPVRRDARTGAEFGWTSRLPPIPLDGLTHLAGHSGVGWLKLPLWGEALKDTRLIGSYKPFSRFSTALARRGIRIVGMLRTPPPAVTAQLPTELTSTSDVFRSGGAIWQESAAAAIGQFGMVVRRWQLGGDHDTAMAALADPAAVLTRTREAMHQIATHLRVGVPWDWVYPVVDVGKAGLAFVSLDLTSELLGEQIRQRIEKIKRGDGEVWVTVSCLPRGRYTRRDRIWDLCERVLFAKAGGADRIFLADVWDPDRGILSPTGAPNELYLVFRTLVEQLSSAEYLGTIQMPAESRNLVFRKGDTALVVLWNPSGPTDEALFLGRRVKDTDVWGAVTELAPRRKDGKQLVRCGPLPVFLSGCSLPVATWRLGVRLESGVVRSSYSPHTDSLRVTNTFAQGVAGAVRVVVPASWSMAPNRWAFQFEAGADHAKRFVLTFPFKEDVGFKRLRLDFDLAADREYRFSVYRRFRFGVEDLGLVVETHLAENGDLVVTQRVSNYTKAPFDGRSAVTAPFRKRRRSVIVKLAADSTDVKVYHFSRGRELVGKHVAVSVEQNNGKRVLNKKVVISP